MLVNNLKIAWRQLGRNRVFSVLNIFGLAVGLTAALLSGLWVYEQHQYDRFHEGRERVFQAMQDYAPNDHIVTDNSVPLPLARVLREETPGVKRVAVTDWGTTNAIAVNDRKLRKHGYYVQADFLHIFDFQLLIGDLANALSAPDQIVLTAATAEALFGDVDPIGQMVSLDQQQNLQVAGVLADIPQTSTWQFDFLLPFSLLEQRQPWLAHDAVNWESYSYQVFFELEEEASITTIMDLHRDVFKQHHPESSSTFNAHKLADWHLYNVFTQGQADGGRIQYVRLFALIGLLVLLVACINFVNLTTARAEQRTKEIGVRKTVGAGRWTLGMQFLAEASLTVGLAAAIALLLTSAVLPSFNLLVAEEIAIPWQQAGFWVLGLGLWFVTVGVAGSLPAWYLSRLSPKVAIQQRGAQTSTQVWSRRTLVSLQFMVAIALIAGSLTVYQQVRFGQEIDRGYDSERLIAIPATDGVRGNYGAIKQALVASGVAVQVSTASAPMTEITSTTDDVSWPGRQADQKLEIAFIAIDPDYFTTLSVDLLEGRTFHAGEKRDTAAMILNAAAVEHMGLTDALSTPLHWGDESYQVVGTVENVIMESPFEPVFPTVYIKRPWQNEILVRLSDTRPLATTLAQVAQEVERLDTSAPFDYHFVADSYAEKFKEADLMGTITLLFAGLAVCLAALGLLGLALYLTERRSKEVSIRKILGASVHQLWFLLSREFLLLVLIGGLLAIPVSSWLLQDWLVSFTYRIDMPWMVFAWAIGLVLLITILTVSGQSLRAAFANPASRLRDE